MPGTNEKVLTAAKLRLVQACVRVATSKMKHLSQAENDLSTPFLHAVEMVKQADAILTAELQAANLMPAVSAQELRDENLPEDQIPLF